MLICVFLRFVSGCSGLIVSSSASDRLKRLISKMKTALREIQTLLHAGCSKAEPEIFAPL